MTIMITKAPLMGLASSSLHKQFLLIYLIFFSQIHPYPFTSMSTVSPIQPFIICPQDYLNRFLTISLPLMHPLLCCPNDSV